MPHRGLPTAQEILDRAAEELDKARYALSEAGSWLRSDWHPVGSPLTRAQADRRRRLQDATVNAQAIIDRSDRWR